MQDLNDKITGGTLTATEWNEVPSEIQNVIEALGQTLSSGDLNQLGKSIAGYIANANFYTDTGIADAYVLTKIGSKQAATSYTDGFTARFIAGNTNTGISTVNISGLGLKDVIGSEIAGSIVAGERRHITYRASSGNFTLTPINSRSVSYTPGISGTVVSDVQTKLRERVSLYDFGVVADGGVTDYTTELLYISDTLNPPSLYCAEGTYSTQLLKVKANCEVCGDGINRTIFETFYTGAQSVTMGQINDNTYVHDLTIQSTETDLENCRTNLESANKVTLERVAFRGFRNPTNSNSWGVYLKNSSEISLLQCGFDDNTQSDIAFVGNVSNVTVDGCYGIASTFHVNFEPNASTDFNENITLKNMHMTKLAFLEAGAGGTANRAINVSGCEIDTLFYGGAEVTLTDCQIAAFEVGSTPFFGELKLNNAVALGPNLLEDPFMVNCAFSSGNAASDNNSWYMNTRSGAVSGDQLDALEEDGVRFVRINPTNAAGTINFRPTNAIAAAAGDYYLVAMTGRRHAGTTGQYIQVYDSANDKDCRVFRQSNEGVNHWTTEMMIFPASATADFLIKVGIYTSQTSSFDLHAVTVHKVLGNGGGESAILNQFHGNIYGPRKMLPVATLPTFSDANVRGVLAGDTITNSTTGAESYWSGSAWVPAGTLVSSTTTLLADITDAINTDAAKVEGYKVYNETTSLYVVAAGNANADVWVYEGTGNTAHTPV